MNAFPPLAVANAVLEEAREQRRSLTIMQLLKLVYIAHGWSLALLSEPLVDEEPEAWQHGPVFPAIYRELRRFGSQPITGLAFDRFGSVPRADLSDRQRSVVRSVVRGYGDMHAFALSDMTHQSGTPWAMVFRDGQGVSDGIPNSLIAEHYRKLADERRRSS
ncbi:MAG: Panacea domain-containing protein [Planctomycetaceae bacterium]